MLVRTYDSGWPSVPDAAREIGRRAAAHIEARHAPERVAGLYWKYVVRIRLLTLRSIRWPLWRRPGRRRADRKQLRRAQSPMRDGVRLSRQRVPSRRRRARARDSGTAPPTARAPTSPPTTRRSWTAATRWWCRMCAGATIPRACSTRSKQETRTATTRSNWIARQPWSNGKVGMIGRLLPRHRAVEGGAAEQSASEGHFPVGFRVRRLPRPLLLAGRRSEAGHSACCGCRRT